MRKKFTFIYPLTQRRVDLHRKGGYRFDHIGNLIVSGVGYLNSDTEEFNEQYEFDIEEISYNGTDILPVLDAFETLDNIEAACFNHLQHLFNNEESEYEIPVIPRVNPGIAKVITLPLKRKVN